MHCIHMIKAVSSFLNSYKSRLVFVNFLGLYVTFLKVNHFLSLFYTLVLCFCDRKHNMLKEYRVSKSSYMPGYKLREKKIRIDKKKQRKSNTCCIAT